PAELGENDFVAHELGRLGGDEQDIDRAVRRHGLAPRGYRCNHMRKGASSCTVLTAVAPRPAGTAPTQSRRSPFIALAVSAMMGRRRNRLFLRISCIV